MNHNEHKMLFLAVVTMSIGMSCATNTKTHSLPSAYNKCMTQTVPRLINDNTQNPKLVAHYLCQVQTSHITKYYQECLPTTTNMFTLDKVPSSNKAAALVCKFYANYCKKSSEDDICEKNYVSSSFKNNPNTSYAGTGVRRPDNGSTLLIDMVRSGDVAAVEAIINRGADVNQSMGGNWTPLTEAENNYDSEMIEMLKQHGGQ